MRIGKGLRGGSDPDSVSCALRVRLEKNEKRLYYALAKAKRLVGRDGKPSLSQALVFAARVGLNCWAEHAEYQRPFAVSQETAEAAELRVTKNPNRGSLIKTVTRRGDGTTTVEYDEQDGDE